MKRFSERSGFKETNLEIQMESLDERLESRLWTAFVESFCNNGTLLNSRAAFGLISFAIFDNFFGITTEILSRPKEKVVDFIRRWFFSAEWYEIYDFIEFCATLSKTSSNDIVWEDVNVSANQFILHANIVLEQERSGYRIVGTLVTPITNEEEIEEIQAAQGTHRFPAARKHVETAIQLYSNRKNPDYRNSIKESISAVEAALASINGQKSKNMPQALKAAKESGLELHPALSGAISQLYGWTSDQDGVRHAIFNAESAVGEPEARFALITCSALINYFSQTA